MNQLQSLKKYTVIVADTGNLQSIKHFLPQDATTNPSLILQAVLEPEYSHFLEEALHLDKKYSGSANISNIIDNILVLFGKEILSIIPGRVSTEVDPRLSFDVDRTLIKARNIIQLYEKNGIDRSRVLIKIASTWEGIQATKVLEAEGIHCNLTLLFSLPQAVAAAMAGARLISPFVGRIYEFYKNSLKRDYVGIEDPGVQSVHEIYNYFKKFDYPTQVMGASFRNTGQIISLAGCDLLTISPHFLDELEHSLTPFEQILSPVKAKEMKIDKLDIDERRFRWLLNQNAMATEKLAEGIRKFTEDIIKLEELIKLKLL